MNHSQRYFLEIAYKGTAYHGWQIQQNAISVQEVLHAAMSMLCRQPVETVGCGRTDTGVHATRFYAHFDLVNPPQDPPRLVASLNAVLPPDIAVKRLINVHAEAHARFDAIRRSYQYHIHFGKDPFLQDSSWHLRDKPDMESMNQAAEMISAYTDFSSFSKSNTQTFTNNCRIDEARWEETGEGMVFHISADRFLRNMVRAIVGTLVGIGRGEMPPEAIRNIIESKDRSRAGESVPAHGLYLTEIIYPYIDQLKSN